MRSLPLAIVIAAFASAAFASPRETVNLTNQLSNPPPCDPGSSPYVNATLVGGYTPRLLVLNGQLAAVATPTLPSEASIQIVSPIGQSFTFQPFPGDEFGPTMTIDLTNFVVRVPIEVPDAAGTWAIRFNEHFNDAGDDARWNNLSITFDDGAPIAKDLGTLARYPLRQLQVPFIANQVRWYRLNIPRPVQAALGTWVDIDTAGSAFPDTMIALYTSEGVRVAFDDDDAGGGASVLTFGAGTRPGFLPGYPMDGRDGALAAGAYYLGVSGYIPFGPGATSWNMVSSSPFTGTIDLRVRGNMVPATREVGLLTQGGAVVNDVTLLPGEVQWFRFEVGSDAINTGSFFVDIDTRGSSLPGSINNNDTEVAVYDATGNLVATDDDGAGSGNLSLLSFGAPGRPPILGGTVPRNGQDGPLPAGVYYLAAAAFNSTFNATDWSVASASTVTGKLRINFQTNTGAPGTCPADLDDGSGEGLPDGGVTIDDLLHFLMRYEGGC